MPIDATVIHWDTAIILLPIAAGIGAFVWPRRGEMLGLAATCAGVVLVTGLGWQIQTTGDFFRALGGWGAPLGIELHVDGLSLLMLGVTALVGLGVSIYAASYFARKDAYLFWPIYLFLLASMNALFVSADLFNLYVTLELVGLATVSLAALTGDAEALTGAIRYLLVTLLASLCYLLGVALLYHAFGTVDIGVLSARIEFNPATWMAIALISAGLGLKVALFPLHFWLPAAHAYAPAPVSVLLSALVVKAPFYILLRLWIDVFGSALADVAAIFGFLGAAAILWGSIQALRQTRLKLLIAYSTIAQVGYLCLVFPLAVTNAIAWQAAIFFALSHSLAKAAMFMAAGSMQRFGGHDRISDLDRVVQRLPLTASAFAIAGVAIIGLPPSGAFVGKWLLLTTAVAQGQWYLVAVVIVGSLMAAGYVFKVVGHAFTRASITHDAKVVAAGMQVPALLLAIAALLLGILTAPITSTLDIGEMTAVGR